MSTGEATYVPQGSGRVPPYGGGAAAHRGPRHHAAAPVTSTTRQRGRTERAPEGSAQAREQRSDQLGNGTRPRGDPEDRSVSAVSSGGRQNHRPEDRSVITGTCR